MIFQYIFPEPILIPFLLATGTTEQKMKFSIKNFFSKCDQISTEKILNGKLHFLCSDQ